MIWYGAVQVAGVACAALTVVARMEGKMMLGTGKQHSD